MIPKAWPRRLAAWVLRAGIRLAPTDAREWGKAMLGELHGIEGNWAAVAWALGGAGVLAKQAVVAFLLRWRKRRTAPVGNPLAKETAMHKASLVTGGVCLAAALLFFSAPVFRQAFRVSLAQWHGVVNVSQSSWSLQPELESLARRVEKKHDAEGMAFVAARLHNATESARLANEAVRLDPKLTWVLGIDGVHHANAPEVPVWIQKLKERDPGNALPYLIEAQRVDIDQAISDRGGLFHPSKPGTAWMAAMAGAFRSKRIDAYAQQLQALDQTVAQRYNLSDPYLVVGGTAPSLPSYALGDSFRYAKLTMASGDRLEASGNTQAAVEKYLSVAHFVQMVGVYNEYPPFVNRIMPDVYTRLAAAYKKMRNGPQSAYFAGLASAGEHEIRQENLRWHSEIENQRSAFAVAPWNALVVEASDIAMLASFCLLLIAIIVVRAQSCTLKPSGRRMGRATTGLGFLGSVGLLVSSVTLYIAYRPFAAIYSRFLEIGDTSQLKILREFLGFTRTPVGTQFYRFMPTTNGPALFGPYISPREFTFYFWLAVTVLGLATVAAIGGRYFLGRLHHRTGTAG